VGVAGPVGFVGRERELSRLQAALAGNSRLLLVTGDAGVGKTRLAGEGMRRAAAGGIVAIWGACLPLAETLPLLPVVQALGELSRVADGRLLETALGAARPYVRAEVARLVPGLGAGEPDGRGAAGGWQRGRLFSAVAEVLGEAARRSAIGLVVEDVHWADAATLDLLTFLLRAPGESALTVVATCRSDQVPLDAQVAGWLAQARGSALAEEIRLGPLSRAEVAEQVTALAGQPAPPVLVDEVYARGEGNPFFTEQLAAAALTGAAASPRAVPARLPARLAALLAARADRCSGQAREVLAALAVAGRPLTAAALESVTELGPDAVRRGLQELAAATLLADPGSGEASRPRHALLAEAVAGALLPAERVILHERTAAALEQSGDEALAAEAAGHWAAARRPARELPARVAAGRAAEQVFAFDQAAAHFLRSIELCHAVPDTDIPASIDLPMLYARATDALDIAGDTGRAGAMAEEAYRLFADHPDQDTAAAIHLRAAEFRLIEQPAAAYSLIEEAIRLAGPDRRSAVAAEAWHSYGTAFLSTGAGDQQASREALQRAAEIAETAGPAQLLPYCLVALADHALIRGEVDEAFALIGRARPLAEACGDGGAILWVTLEESFALSSTGQAEACTETALAGLRTAGQLGRQDSREAAMLAGNACSGLIQRGRTAEAAALIDPLTTGQPSRDNTDLHLERVEIDLLRGHIGAARQRLAQVQAIIIHRVGLFAGQHGTPQLAAELALWAGRPRDALDTVLRALPSLTPPPFAYQCGALLAAGIRACADLAEQALARHDQAALAAAQAAAGTLESWADQVAGVPFADHPAMVCIPADRATWDAEQARLAGANDPAAWAAAAKASQSLGWPHKAGYASWRQAQAELDAGQPATAAGTALRAAAVAAAGHAPLLAQIQKLAERARIPLQPARARSAVSLGPAAQPEPYGLTARELTVLRLLADGRTNAQIGAALYISPKTASVHVTSILRKLGVSGRVQAAAIAERAGLLGRDSHQTPPAEAQGLAENRD